jgi:hypothetical protein
VDPDRVKRLPAHYQTQWYLAKLEMLIGMKPRHYGEEKLLKAWEDARQPTKA